MHENDGEPDEDAGNYDPPRPGLRTEEGECHKRRDEGDKEGQRGHRGRKLEVPGDLGTGNEMHTDHADKVHAPHGDGSEASRSCTKQHVISPSSRGRPATEKGESGVRTEDGDNDGSDKCAGDWADGYSMNSVVPDELLGVIPHVLRRKHGNFEG